MLSRIIRKVFCDYQKFDRILILRIIFHYYFFTSLFNKLEYNHFSHHVNEYIFDDIFLIFIFFMKYFSYFFIRARNENNIIQNNSI